MAAEIKMPLMHAAAPQPRLELAARQMTCWKHSPGEFCQQPCLRPARRHRPSVRHLSVTKPTSAASLRRSSAVHGAETSQCYGTQPGSAAHSATPNAAHSTPDKQPRISDLEPLWSDAFGGGAEHRTTMAMAAAAAAAVVLQAGAVDVACPSDQRQVISCRQLRIQVTQYETTAAGKSQCPKYPIRTFTRCRGGVGGRRGAGPGSFYCSFHPRPGHHRLGGVGRRCRRHHSIRNRRLRIRQAHRATLNFMRRLYSSLLISSAGSRIVFLFLS